MKVAILGAGVIGTTIGRRWRQSGHQVVYGARDPSAAHYREVEHDAAVTAIPDAVADAQAVLLAVPGEALESLLTSHGSVLDGKLVLDATNRLGGASFHQIPLLESRLPAARVYRAFNTLGWENFAEPDFDGERADLFYSGPEADDREVVERLIEAVGLHPVHVGAGSPGADLLDGVTRLWFSLAVGQGRGRHLAFKTLVSGPDLEA